MLQLVGALLSNFCQHDFEFDIYIFSAWKHFNTSRFVRCEEFESVSWSQFSGSLLMTRCCWTQLRWCGAARRLGLIQQVWPRGATWQIREMEPGDMVKIWFKIYVKISANKDLKIQTYVKEVYILSKYIWIYMNEIRSYVRKTPWNRFLQPGLQIITCYSILTLDTFFDTPSRAANSLGQSSEATRMPLSMVLSMLLSMLLLLLLIHSNWKKCQELCLKTRSSWCPRIWRVHSSFRNRH